MRLRMLPAVVLALTLTPRAADAAPPVRHEGKTLAEWITQIEKASEDKSREAIRAVGRARFLVEAPPVIVPVLVEIIEESRGVTNYTAVSALASYGPLAREAVGVLRPKGRGSDLPEVAARVLIGDGVAEGLRQWQEDADRALDTADRTTRGMKLPKELEFADTPFYHAMTSVNVALAEGGNLGLRGVGVPAFAAKALQRPYGHLIDGTVLFLAQDLGAASAPLAARLVPYLKDKEPVYRARVAGALAWVPGLPRESVKAMLTCASTVTHVGTLRRIAQGIAVTAHEPKDDVVLALRALAGKGDRTVAAWAVAGLARRAVDLEKTLPLLLTHLKSPEHDVRAAAADGLLSLGEWTEATRAEAVKGLADPDRRVRWRCGAILAAGEGETEGALSALALGIDGPDDVERVAAIEAAGRLGSVAGPLRAQIREWSNLPCPLIADPARRALEAIGGE